MPITKLASKLHRTMGLLSSHWDRDDLIQEGYLKALLALRHWRGDASMKTYMVSNVRNHLIDMARRASARPRVPTDKIDQISAYRGQSAPPPEEQLILRSSTTDLLGWLKENPSEVGHGWEVLNLMLWTHGNTNYVALAMTVHTKQPWTTEKVHTVIRKIKATARGGALCEFLGIAVGDGNKRSNRHGSE